MLKKIGLWILAIILIPIILIFSIAFISSEEKPNGLKGEKAEELANKMLNTLHLAQWQDISIIEWEFPRGHKHLWDKKRNLVEVSWDQNRAIFNNQTKEGMAWVNGQELIEKDQIEEVVNKAWDLFNNDSFWLCAPFKVKDPGTTRSFVEIEGQDALLVEYNSGGTTPGDAYLWILDEKGFPTSYKMWVSIIPIGGLEFSWDGWQKHKGAWLAPDHQSNFFFSVDLKNIKTYSNFSERLNGADPFGMIDY